MDPARNVGNGSPQHESVPLCRRTDIDEAPYAEHLIHRLSDGRMVSSKSELAIGIELQRLGLWEQCDYERVLEGTKRPGRLRPDFTFIDDAGDPIIWEHLGMLGKKSYQRIVGVETPVVRRQRLRDGQEPFHDRRLSRWWLGPDFDNRNRRRDRIRTVTQHLLVRHAFTRSSPQTLRDRRSAVNRAACVWLDTTNRCSVRSARQALFGESRCEPPDPGDPRSAHFGLRSPYVCTSRTS